MQQSVGQGSATSQPPICAYCGKPEGEAKDEKLQWAAIGSPTSLAVENVWLHPPCMRGYLRLTEPS